MVFSLSPQFIFNCYFLPVTFNEVAIFFSICDLGVSLIISNSLLLLFVQLSTLLFEDVEKSLGTFEDFVVSALRLLNGLIIFISRGVFPCQRLINYFKAVGQRLHLFFNLAFLFLLLINKILNFLSLPFNTSHHLGEFGIRVVHLGSGSHFCLLNSKLIL